MHESLVNREGDRLPENRKGREETPNWSRCKDGKQHQNGKRTPNEMAFPAINCMRPG
jgi:hypothetical protein